MKTLILILLSMSTNLFAGDYCAGKIIEKNEATIRLYDPQKSVSRQIVILPPTGGENKADRRLAKALCQRGHLVKVVDYPQEVVTAPDFEGHERVTKDILKVFSDFFSREKYPTTIIGASLGGIYAGLIYSLAQGQDPAYEHLRLVDSLVATVAGGPLPSVLATSTQEAVMKTRNERLASGRFSNIEEYRSYLDGLIFTDTMKLLHTNKQVLFYGSTNDTVVPTKTQVTLSSALLGQTFWIKGLGHSGTVAYVYYSKASEISFFIRNLP